MLKGIWGDLIHAGRSLAKARAFTFVCVVSLGVGMAPVIAVSGAVRMFTMPPPGIDPEGLVELVTIRLGPHRPGDRWTYSDFADLRNAGIGVELTGWASGETTVEKKSVPTMFVSANYFRTVGVSLARGPGFDAASAERAVVLGHNFWQNQLASDPDIVGKTLTLDEVPHVVVGVAPPLFGGHLALQEDELFVPLERHPRNARSDRDNEWIRIHGRLSPGVSIAQASAAVSAATSRLAKEYPAPNEFRAGKVEAYHAIGSLEGSATPIITAAWLSMTGMVLLVVCLNLSGMVQVRTAMRERELSIRQAIGATRARLVQYLLAEAILLAGVGGTIASVLLFNIPPLIASYVGEPLPPQMEAAMKVDLSVLAICAGLCLLTSLMFGLLPATRFSRPMIISSLKDDAGVGGFRVGRVHRVTAALQVMIAVPLLVLSGVSIDRARAIATADLGYEPELLYAAPLNLDTVADIGNGAGADFRIRSVRDDLLKASGVASVTVADGLPLDSRHRITRLSLETEANVAPKFTRGHVTRVGEEYLETMGIALLRGRAFTGDDGAAAEKVTVISQTLARRLFQNSEGEAIGKRLTFGAEEKPQTVTIVGVTEDFPTSQMRTDQAQLLLPLAQHPGSRWDSVAVNDDAQGTPNVMLIVRSAAGEPAAKMTAALETAVREFDPKFDAASIVTGASRRQDHMDLTDSAAMASIGGVILMLAALGIYGVVGLMVATRTREIAVRVALGASRRRVLGMILFDVVKLVMPGVAAGLIITGGISRLGAEDLGLSLSTLESLAYVAGGAIAILVAVLASLGPARRAASVQPMVAMRSE